MSEFRTASTAINPGLSVIEASAGTGKTHAITHLVPRLLLEGAVDKIEHILLVTYTNDAAGELAERVRIVLERLHEDPAPDEAAKHEDLHAMRLAHGGKVREVIGRALLDIDRLNVSTIHAFCLRTLEDEGALCGLPVMPELVPDIGEMVETSVRDLWDERLTRDPRLAPHAVAGEWKIGEDVELALLASGHDNCGFVPPPRDLEDTLDAIDRCRADLTDERLGVLREFVAAVPEDLWNAAAGGEKSRQKHLGNLPAGTPVADWLSAVQWIAAMPLKTRGLINGKKTAGKALIAEASALEAVKIAGEAALLAKDLKWAWQTHCARAATRNASSRMKTDRHITYDALISRVRHALVDSPHRRELARRLRQRFKVALVDESQDTDPRQFDIFRTVFLGDAGDDGAESHRLVLVGDPKQAIYAFRGADLNTYLEAREGAPQDQVFTLSRTFRAPPKLVAATNAFFARNGSFLNPGIAMTAASAGRPEQDVFLEEPGGGDGPRLEVWMVEGGDEDSYDTNDRRLETISESVAAKIAHLLESRAAIVQVVNGQSSRRAVGPGDFAVLVNRHVEAEAVCRALAEAGVPAVSALGSDVMRSDEAADVFALLRALAEPRRQKLRFTALATRLLGRSASALRELAATEDAMCETFVRWGRVLEAEGVAAALAVIDAEERLSERLAALPGGERRLTNLRQLTDLLQSAFESHGNHAGRLLRWAARERLAAGENARTGDEERQQQLESDAKAVKVATMHSAKGLEFPLVFCPFLWSPGRRKGEKFRKLMSRGEATRLVCLADCDAATKKAMLQAEIEERLRLTYVAMTRAQVKLWIHAGALADRNFVGVPTSLDWLLRLGGEDSLEHLTEDELKDRRGTRQKEGLERLIEEAGAHDVIGVSAPHSGNETWAGDAGDDAPLAAAEVVPAIPETWSLTSFSSLTREKNPKGGDAPPEPGGDDAAAVPDAPANAFLDAPAGALVGTAIHDWMESWDFSPPDSAAVEEHLRRYALSKPKEGPPWCERVISMLGDLRGSGLPGFDCTMAEACADPAASEWHFQLPLQAGIGPKKLADIFARHGEEDYAALLETLPEAELQGYLHGFIDRIAVDPQTQQWGVIDWKTNKLGTSAAAHRKQSSLLRCAKRSHYFLQMHLYLVALRRFLGPANAPGDAWLVFLRGVRDGTADGILHIKPGEELLRDLGNLFRTVRTS